MLSLHGNVYSHAAPQDTRVLRQIVKGGSLPKVEKQKLTKAITKIEKEEEKQKQPARDLRAMYGND